MDRKLVPNAICPNALRAAVARPVLSRARRAALIAGASTLLMGGAATAQNQNLAEADQHWDLLETYCTECHNFEDWAGSVAFDIMTPEEVPADAEIWEHAVQRLRGNLMPPPGSPQPDQDEIGGFVHWMEAYLDSAAPEHNAGHVPIQRLNRTEYAVAVKGLVGVDIDPEAVLPTEIEVEGFDNIASALGTSPSFLEQYVSAARQVAALAVGDAAPKLANTFYPATGGQDNFEAGLPLGLRAGMRVVHNFPADGEYHINIMEVDAGLYPRAMETRHTMVVLVDREEVYRTQFGGPEDLALVDREGANGRAELLERVTGIPAQVSAGNHEIVVAFIERAQSRSDDLAGGGTWNRQPRVTNGIQVVGPYNPTGLSMSETRQKIFVCYPETEAEQVPCARDIARDLAGRAYRRPVTEEDVDVLMPFFEVGREGPGGFDEGIEHVVAAVLASPNFLYRSITPDEDQQDQQVYALDDLELASRLAFFLWGQGPDKELIDIAAKGDLSEGDELERQVWRMLDDPRAEHLVSGFAMKWLNLDELDAVEPDGTLFRAFNESLRQDFATELELFLSGILLEDRSIVEILDSDETYVNDRLARHYGIRGVNGGQFRRITLEDEARHGILGKAAFQLRSSYGDRTSPVLRGAWVLEKLMGTPPTPPPPGVETDLTPTEGDLPITLRARLEEHRADPSCNSCHGVIDPLGLALENFDAIGRWRDDDVFAGAKIDASTVLPNGIAIDGPVELRAQLVGDPEQFAWAMTQKLMMYAINREVEYHDMPEVRAIVRDAAEDDYRFSSLILGVVNSDAFHMQHVPEGELAEDGGAERVQEAALTSE